MVELNMVTTRLQQMRRRLGPLMDALVNGAPEEVQERNLRLAELDQINNSLRIIVRDIRNEQNRIQAAQGNLGNVPRDNRWSANQSLDQQRKNLQNARKQAEDLAQAVRQLMEKNGFLSPVQASMKLMDLIENIEKTADQAHAIQQIMSELGVPTITMPKTESPSISSLIPVFVFIIYEIRRITGKK
jgi:hypothetical protein